MSQLIWRVYGTRENAESAATELARRGWGQHAYVFYPSAPDAETPATEASVTAEIVKADVARDDAALLAQDVMGGASVILIYPHWGTATQIIQVLDAHHPIASRLQQPIRQPVVADNAAPLSSWLGLRVLSNDPTPFATFFNLPTLGRRGLTFSGMELKPSDSYSSNALGMPLLSNDPAPLSRWLNLRVLKDWAPTFGENPLGPFASDRK